MAENVFGVPDSDASFLDIFNSTTAETAPPSLYRDDTTDAPIEGTDPSKSNPYAFGYDEKTGMFGELNLNSLVMPYENVLFGYSNVTWNFSLYTMNSTDYAAFWNNPTQAGSKYIIAQSGVTGRYSINSVTISTACPASPGITSNFAVNTMTIEIVENGGMSLYDDIVVLSNELGYQKFIDVPFIMELNFIGYDENGVAMNIPGTNKKWGVIINNIKGKANASAGAMTYTLSVSGARTGEVDNKNWTLKEAYSCNAATFGDFVHSIENKLNAMAKAQYGYLALKYPKFANDKFFEMIIDPELAAMVINYDAKQSPSVGATETGGEGAKRFSWDAGTPFSRAVDDVLDSCTINNAISTRPFVNIVPVSRYVGYDNIRQTHAYKQDFYFIKYKIGDITSAEDLTPDKFNTEYFYKFAEKVLDPLTNEPKLHMKRYDYQFSGLNNEILELDIKVDQGFSVAVTRNPSSQVDTQNTRGTHASTIIEFGDSTYNISNKDDFQELWKRKAELESKVVDEGYILSDEEKQLVRDVEAAGKDIQGVVEGQNNQDDTITYVPPNSSYIEDFRDTVDLTVEGTKGIGIPKVDSIPIEPTNTKIDSSGSQKDSSSPVEMNHRQVRDNYYNRAFLSKLDMKVKGDPFWLGWGDYAFLEYLNRAVQGKAIELSPEDSHFVNYLTSEAYLLLNLKPIASISDETGLIEINSPSIFSQTIYRVNKITSEFSSNGKFTQMLNAGLVVRSLNKKEKTTDVTEGGQPNG